MPEITIRIAGKGLSRTTVEGAITRGRRKVQEARSLREAQEAAHAGLQTPLTASGMEQGDMLDPFNFTTALRIKDRRDEKDKKGRHEVKDAKEPTRARHKPDDKEKMPGDRTEKAEDSPLKEKEAEENRGKDVQADERGAVVEEKEAEGPAGKVPGKEISSKRTVRTVIRNAPVHAAFPEQDNEKNRSYRSTPAGTGARVFVNIQKTDRKPEELRLNAGPRTVAGERPAGPAKSMQEERSSDRTDGLIRTEQPGGTMQPMQDTAYKPTEYIPSESCNIIDSGREDAVMTGAQPARGAAGMAAVTMPAGQTAREMADRRALKEEAIGEPLQGANERKEEVPLEEAASGKEAMNRIIDSARENADAGNLVMQAAAIAHTTGRELQFEKGSDLLQIRKEGNETFAYINGDRSDIGKAREFMKDFSRSLGPELSGQMKDMMKTLSQNPALSMQQAAENGNRQAVQMEAVSADTVTRD